MAESGSVEIKAFVPAKDFELSKCFYQDLGFNLSWVSDELAYFSLENCSFFLQNFYVREHAESFMMQLLVADLDAWWMQVQAANLGEKYGVHLSSPELRPWGIRDFVLIDPSGVLWRIAQKPAAEPA